MDPQQYPSGQNPYDFILNPPKPPKASPLAKLPGGGNPFVAKIILLAGVAIVIMIILAIVSSFLTKGSSANTTALIDIAQTQAELIRVSDQGVNNASQQSVKNLAITTKYTAKTQQNQLIKYLSSQGATVNPKQLTLKRNAQTDQKFTVAQQTSTFDAVFAKEMQSELQTYATSLKQLFNTATGENERTLLSTDYTQAQLLISQIPSNDAIHSN
jgi:hypothetical protein